MHAREVADYSPSITLLGKSLARLPVRAGKGAKHGVPANQSPTLAVILP
jgi:hypothetical protein